MTQDSDWDTEQCASLTLSLVVAQILEWNKFDVFAVARSSKGRPLQTVTWALLQHYGLVEALDIPEDKLRRYLKVQSCPSTQSCLSDRWKCESLAAQQKVPLKILGLI